MKSNNKDVTDYLRTPTNSNNGRKAFGTQAKRMKDRQRTDEGKADKDKKRKSEQKKKEK